ncbi:MAG: hypothetical protein QXL69_03575 [Candidatus Bathyarchaeia archaeon]|nr:hypothetical protein [Candidatus Bathyarchaeota archaeon]
MKDLKRYCRCWRVKAMSNKKVALIFSIIIIVFINVLLEKFLIPLFREGIPLPYPATGKPIGSVLLPATFFHVLMISGSVFAIGLIADKLGFKLDELTPKTMQGKINLVVFFIMLTSGIIMWWYPIAFLPFIITAAYLTIIELS